METGKSAFKGLTLLGIYLALMGSVLPAAGQFYSVRTFNESNGLLQPYVYTILQDSLGYLWLGTHDGLVRYDGAQFRIFTTEHGLAENFITTSLITAKGRLVFGHFKGGISISREHAFEALPSLGLNRKINDLAEDHQGYLWIATQGNGLAILDPELRRVPVDSMAIGRSIQKLAPGPGHMYLAGDKGLYKARWTGSKIEYTHLPAMNGVTVNDLRTDPADGSIWIATRRHGLKHLLTGDQDRIVDIPLEDEATSVDLIFPSRSAHHWISQPGKGASCWISEGQRMVKMGFQPEIRSIHPYIRSIYEDNERNIWLGTYGTGLVQLMHSRLKTFSLFNGLPGNEITGVHFSGSGDLLLGTPEGFYRVPVAIHEHSLEPDLKAHQRLGAGFKLTAVAVDSSKNVWLGSAANGLYVYRQGKLSKISWSDRLSTINDLAFDNDQQLWIATIDGLLQYDPVSREQTIYNTRNGLYHNNIKSLLTGPEKTVWLGPQRSGVMQIAAGKPLAKDWHPVLNRSTVLCMATDRSGVIWMGTEGNGLFSYDGRSVHHYTTESGLLSNYCYTFTLDHRGKLWIGQQNGLTVYDPDDRSFMIYDSYNGFAGGTVQNNAVASDVHHNLWFGTDNGLVYVHTAAPRFSSAAIPLHLVDFVVSDESTPMAPGTKLPYDNYKIGFEFSAVHFIRPDQIRYQYTLEGYETEWSDITSKNAVVYPQLEDGRYTFKVRAGTANTLASSQPTVFSFTIAKPIWKQWWFYVIILVLLFGGFYTVIRIRERNLIRYQRILRQRIRQATKVISEKKREIENQRDQLRDTNLELAMINNNLNESIASALIIQETMLPALEEIKKAFPDSFLFYRPKHTVSGDFYWLGQHKGQTIIAAADCTGHGVPGALISMLGFSSLNKVVHEMGEVRPDKILDKLSDEMDKVINKKETVGEGMDIALCAINPERTTLNFAGGYNPLYVVRNNELIVYKANSFSIGGYDFIPKEQRAFTNHSLSILPGDCVYLFSDGYADQFGGEKGKKLTTKKFKALLLRIHQLPMPEQKKILDTTIDEWKGDWTQVDDMQIIGIRF